MNCIQSICILGRQPELGLAELSARYGNDAVEQIGPNVAALNIPASEIDFHQLGGSVKLAKVLTFLPDTEWKPLYQYLCQETPKHVQMMPEGRLTIGVSLYGIHVRPAKLREELIAYKKMIGKSAERTIRIVPNKTLELSTPQILHNKLTGPSGWELLFVKNKDTTILAQTVEVQDIEAYGARDQARPYRDAKNGMLPPKLAQILINLAVGQNRVDRTILDPFCGTGVVLQEALLMGYDVTGTDSEAKMIEYSIGNIAWLRDKIPEAAGYVRIELGDATTHQWPQKNYTVAAETYLGPPLSTLPGTNKLLNIIKDVDGLHRRVLTNLTKQLPKGSRLCLAVPAWQAPNGRLYHLPVLDDLARLGYNRMSFPCAGTDRLVYRRPGQTVCREIVALTRK